MSNVVEANVENFSARLVELGLPLPDDKIKVPEYIVDRIRALANGKLLIVREMDTALGPVHVIAVEGDPTPLYFQPFKS